jgi:hypothetical protein
MRSGVYREESANGRAHPIPKFQSSSLASKPIAHPARAGWKEIEVADAR